MTKAEGSGEVLSFCSALPLLKRRRAEIARLRRTLIAEQQRLEGLIVAGERALTTNVLLFPGGARERAPPDKLKR